MYDRFSKMDKENQARYKDKLELIFSNIFRGIECQNYNFYGSQIYLTSKYILNSLAEYLDFDPDNPNFTSVTQHEKDYPDARLKYMVMCVKLISRLFVFSYHYIAENLKGKTLDEVYSQLLVAPDSEKGTNMGIKLVFDPFFLKIMKSLLICQKFTEPEKAHDNHKVLQIVSRIEELVSGRII